ncbi:hypothetical protein OEZ86_003431 [Tetradesmus obliquus]|nr:hypothetical protein OEZ86_003431 [Tetradesmus obliquus]
MARILKKGNDVFYNEAQVTNRDLSVAVLRQFLPQLAQEKAEGKLRKPGQAQKDKRQAKKAAAKAAAQDEPAQPAQAGARVLEGLAASGLRSIRYALELDGVSRIDANDVDPAVVESMRANIALNGPGVAARVVPTCSDARLLMLQNPEAYDAIDLDPYGTPAHFLDSALQAVAEGGLLAVTATDMAVLCGNSGEVCWTKYGSYPIHRPYCHEAAVRILLACLESHANRYKRYIVPLLSVHMDFYIRVFVRVFTSAAEIKASASKQAYVWQSQGCDSWWLQPVGQQQQKGSSTKHMPAHGPAVPSNRCPESGAAFLMGGPIWARPLHDQAWVAGLLQQMDQESGRYAQHARLKGILTSVLEELPDVPLYYNVHDMCRTVRCTPPRAEQLRSALINAGFRVSGSHANPLALKTDAPPKVVWDIIRCWVKLHPIKPPEPNSYPAAILSKEIETEADFRKAAGAVPESVKAGVKRFVQNPAFWGPKARHGRPLKPEQQKQQQAQAEQRRTRQQQQQQQEGQGAAAAAADSDSSGGAAAGGSNGSAAAAAAAAVEDAAAEQQQQQGEAAAAAAADGDDLLSMLYDKEDGEAERPPKKARKVPAAAAAAAGSS